MSYKSFCSTEIVFGTKKELLDLLASLNQSFVLIMSKSAAARWELDSFIERLQSRAEARSVSFTWISPDTPYPTPHDVENALKQIGGQMVDTIVAIGGGSVIDLGKAISAFMETRNRATVKSIIDSIKRRTYVQKRFADVIAVPTTAGTGAELTQWATIWDKDHGVKYSIDAVGLQPKLALIVPELTTSLSPTITLSTGLDAICQAVEAYWSKHTSPLIQETAYRAVELIAENLRVAVDEPENLKARELLCVASVLAGLAFANTKTTACHSISYPLTLYFGVPHGFAVALTMDAVSKINMGHYPNDKRLMSVFETHGGIGGWIEKVCAGVVTMRLSAFGISKNDLGKITQHAFTIGRMDNNPVDLTDQDVLGILERIL